MYSTDQKWTIALLKLLNDMNAPDYAFSRILKWAHHTQTEGYSFQPVNGGLSRIRNVDVLFASLTNDKRVLPSVATVQLNNGATSDVITTFEFVPQLLNLLQNPELMTSEKLEIDPLNPLLPYISPDGRLGIRHTRLFWHSTQYTKQDLTRTLKISNLFKSCFDL